MESNSNNKVKPVWRLNQGRGVPSALGGSYMYRDLDIYDVCGNVANYEKYWRINSRSSDIYAYETNRTKSGKATHGR